MCNGVSERKLAGEKCVVESLKGSWLEKVCNGVSERKLAGEKCVMESLRGSWLEKSV